MKKLVATKPVRATVALIAAVPIAACAMLIDPRDQTTEWKVAAATAKCNLPRDAIILHKDRTYEYNLAYLRDAEKVERMNCVEFQLMECDDGVKMLEPMGCVRQDNAY